MDSHGELAGAAARRRGRWLRAWHRHVKMTVAMELATALHHSAQPAWPVVAGPREVEEQDKHEALRRQKAPPPGVHLGVLKEPEVQGVAVTDGYVAAGAPLVVVASLAGGDDVEATTASYLVSAALLREKKDGEEEEESRGGGGGGEGERLPEMVALPEVPPGRLSAEQQARLDVLLSSKPPGKRNRKKKRKKKVPTFSSSCAARTWESRQCSTSPPFVLPEEYALEEFHTFLRAGCARAVRIWESGIILRAPCFRQSLLRYQEEHRNIGFSGRRFRRGWWRRFHGPLYLAVACSTLFVPEEYAVFLGEDFRICRIQRFLVRQWIHVTAGLRSLWVLFPYTAQCLVLSGTCCASVTDFSDFRVFTWNSTSDPKVDSRRNCGLSAVAAHLQGRRHPCCDTVQLPIGIPQLPVDKVVDVPVLLVERVPHVPSWRRQSCSGVSTASCGLKLVHRCSWVLCTGTGPGLTPAIMAGKGWRGRRESDSKVTCHPN